MELACSDSSFFNSYLVPNEEQYFLMKKFLVEHMSSEIAKSNDQIHSCSFNSGVDFSYLYFKDSAITTAFYDNDIHNRFRV